MPTLRRTPFNQGGSYVPDAYDQIETGNRNAALQNAQFQYGAQQNDRMAQLALAKLNQENYQFGQGRADNMAMFREKLAADTHGQDLQAGLTREGWTHDDSRFGKQFDYMTGRDKRADAQHQQEWDFEHDQTKNPQLMAAFQNLAVQKRLADEMQRQNDRGVARDKIMDEAGAAAPDMTGWSPQDITHYKARLGLGVAPSAAGSQVGDEILKRGQDEVEGQEQSLGSDLAHFSQRDNNWFGADAQESDVGALGGRLAKLEEALRLKFDLSQGAAHDRANKLINTNTRQSANSQKVDALRRLRGLPE